MFACLLHTANAAKTTSVTAAAAAAVTTITTTKDSSAGELVLLLLLNVPGALRIGAHEPAKQAWVRPLH